MPGPRKNYREWMCTEQEGADSPACSSGLATCSRVVVPLQDTSGYAVPISRSLT